MLMMLMNGSVHTIQKKTEALIGTSKENGLEVNTQLIKYMFRDKHACQNHNISYHIFI